MAIETIVLENVTAGHGPDHIVKDISWTILSGENWVVTGEMGAGKTTLLQTIYGKARRLSGYIKYQYLKDPGSFEERKASMSFVSFTDRSSLFNNARAIHYYQQRYQAFDSEGHLTVEQYLQVGGLDLGNGDHIELLEMLDLFPLLRLERIKLSSGQTRKLLLCKALLSDPTFLLFDNPHAGLDPTSRKILNHYIDKIAETGKQIIMAGHFRKLPKCIDRELNLSDGKVMYTGLVRMNKPVVKPESKIPGRIIREFKDKPVPDFDELLNFKNIQIRYDKKKLYTRLSWCVKKGEKWLLAGGNGSGKSTLISLIYGDHPQAYSNDVSLFDHPRGSGETIWEIKQRIGFTSSELHSYFRYNYRAIDIVLSGLWDTFFVRKDVPEKKQMAESLFQYFGLESQMEKQYLQLSTGMQRLVFFMRSLIKAPPVLLLDEPYQCLDLENTVLCNSLLATILSPEHTMIFISHFEDEVPEFISQKLEL